MKVVKEMLNSEGFPIRYEGVRRLWKRYLEGRQAGEDRCVPSEVEEFSVDRLLRQFPTIKAFINDKLFDGNELTA